jgi:hypothetical protein
MKKQYKPPMFRYPDSIWEREQSPLQPLEPALHRPSARKE